MNTLPPTIIRTLREPVPMRPLTLSEAYAITELQANKLVELLGVQVLQAVELGWIMQVPRVTVIGRPRHEMPRLAGFTQWQHGHYLVVINRSNNMGRRRFTLGHEFKHVIDHSLRKIIYANLGQGDQEKHDDQIEQIANYFSACLLMPRKFVKSTWSMGIQDIESMAQVFRVSNEAMTNRLKYLGLIEDEMRPVEALFRDELPKIMRTLAAEKFAMPTCVA